VIQDFQYIRPILHTGYEGIMFLYLLVVGHTRREEIKQRFHVGTLDAAVFLILPLA